MQIELTIDGKKKVFVTTQVPMLARRKFLEIQAKEEELLKEGNRIPANKQIEFENELINLMTDVIFDNQFTVDELLAGVSDKYFNEKLAEAVFGLSTSDEGNEVGK